MMNAVLLSAHRCRVACLLAGLMLLPLAASLTAGEDEMEAPKPLTAADYTPVLDLRMNQVGASLADLKSFLDAGLPIGSLQAVYFAKIYLVHSTTLAGVDSAKAVHTIGYAPKALLSADRQSFRDLAAQSAVAQLVPVKDEAAFLAQMKIDAENIQPQGDYQLVQFVDVPLPLLFKLSKGYAVFSPMPMGMELGLAQVDAVAAADAAAQEGPSIVLELKPRALLAAADITGNEAKTQAAQEMLAGISGELGRELTREMGLGREENRAAARLLAQKALEYGPQCESLQLYMNLEPLAASFGARLQAAEGSDLAQAVAALQPLDSKALCGLSDAREVITYAGSLDANCVALLSKIYAQVPPEGQKMFAPVVAGLKDLPGHAWSGALGIDGNGQVVMGGELNLNADSDLNQAIQSLVGLETTLSGISQMEGGIYGETETKPGADQDGWKVTFVHLKLKADRPMMARLLQQPQFQVVATEQVFCLLAKDGRLVAGSGADEAAAQKRALQYAAHQDHTGLNPAMTALIAANCKNRGATGVALFDMYPVIKLAMEMTPEMPSWALALIHAMAPVDPIMVTALAKDRAVQMEMRLNTDNLKPGAGTAILAAIAIPNLLASKVAANETAAVQNLKALATAQAQFIRRNDFYAVSGDDLNTHGTLIAADLKNAFEEFQKNGDEERVAPKAGYVFRMLQGDSKENPTSFRKDANDPAAGMNTWAAIARPVEPGTSGENQYLISEAGTVYKHVDTFDNADEHYKRFLLDHLPSADELEELGWTPAR